MANAAVMPCLSPIHPASTETAAPPEVANTSNAETTGEGAFERRAVERYARAYQDIAQARDRGLAVLPHQSLALERAGQSLDRIRPHASTDLASAFARRSELASEAAEGRSQSPSRLHRRTWASGSSKPPARRAAITRRPSSSGVPQRMGSNAACRKRSEMRAGSSSKPGASFGSSVPAQHSRRY